MVQAVIFDMDGLLVDSEPWWQQAQREVFSGLGVPVSEAVTRELVGLRTQDHIAYWYARYPWAGPSWSEVAQAIAGRAVALIRQHGGLMPGAGEAVRRFHREGMPLAVASSSSSAVIIDVLEHFEILPAFAALQSAEFEPHGKPHPGVYLSAAKRLGVDPKACLAIEDSVTGVTAAKAAGMTCIVVPSPEMRDDPRYCIADAVVSSLDQVTPRIARELHALAQANEVLAGARH